MGTLSQADGDHMFSSGGPYLISSEGHRFKHRRDILVSRGSYVKQWRTVCSAAGDGILSSGGYVRQQGTRRQAAEDRMLSSGGPYVKQRWIVCKAAGDGMLGDLPTTRACCTQPQSSRMASIPAGDTHSPCCSLNTKLTRSITCQVLVSKTEQNTEQAYELNF